MPPSPGCGAHRCFSTRWCQTGLRLASVDIDATFGKALVHEAVHVERVFLAHWVLEQIALFATLWVYSRRGGRYARESAAGPIGTGMLLGMLGLGIVWLVQLPFGLIDLWWARRHGLSEMGYVGWAFDHWFELGGTFVSLCRRPPRRHVPRSPASANGGGFRARRPSSSSAPRSLSRSRTSSATRPPSRIRACSRSADAFERQQGISGVPVSVEDVSGTTSQANAYAVGFGPSRKVVLWSTMVDGGFSDAEVRVVLAHEIGHHSSDHIPKGVAWFALFALPGAWVLMRATRHRGGMGEAASVPLALLVVALIQLALTPAQSWISRRMEAEADWKALQTTRDPTAAQAVRPLQQDVARKPRAAALGSRPARQPSDPLAASRHGRSMEPAAPSPVADRLTSACIPAPSRPRGASDGRRGR